MVIRRLFIAVQTSGDSGWCSQMVHCSGSPAWPFSKTVSMCASRLAERINSHLSHMEVSQQGSLTAFTATRLQRPQRNLAGISPGSRVLDRLARARMRSGMEKIHGEVVLVVVEFCCHGGADG
jgi:hypothetical protein